MVMLLQAVEQAEQVEQVERLYAERNQAAMTRAARRAAKQDAALPAVAGMGLKSWREVVTPHRDVRSGNFNAAEFAANLHHVVRGEATQEYSDAVEFFERTHLTEGLRDLIKPGIARICGDANAAPPRARTRFFGVAEIDSQRYGREFTRLQQEIIAHLVATESSSVRITVELEANRPDGFSDDTMRTVSENARVLRFDRAEFE